jgi:hypothetical protein
VSTFVALVLDGDDAYISGEPWRDDDDGKIHVELKVTGPMSSFTTLHGPAAELHRLAAALTKAAAVAEDWGAKHPKASSPRGGRPKAVRP